MQITVCNGAPQALGQAVVTSSRQEQEGWTKEEGGKAVGTSELPAPRPTALNGDLILRKILYMKSYAYVASSELPCDAS